MATGPHPTLTRLLDTLTDFPAEDREAIVSRLGSLPGTKAQAMSHVTEIATQAAADIVAQLTGKPADQQKIAAAIAAMPEPNEKPCEPCSSAARFVSRRSRVGLIVRP